MCLRPQRAGATIPGPTSTGPTPAADPCSRCTGMRPGERQFDAHPFRRTSPAGRTHAWGQAVVLQPVHSRGPLTIEPGVRSRASGPAPDRAGPSWRSWAIRNLSHRTCAGRWRRGRLLDSTQPLRGAMSAPAATDRRHRDFASCPTIKGPSPDLQVCGMCVQRACARGWVPKLPKPEPSLYADCSMSRPSPGECSCLGTTKGTTTGSTPRFSSLAAITLVMCSRRSR